MEGASWNLTHPALFGTWLVRKRSVSHHVAQSTEEWRLAASKTNPAADMAFAVQSQPFQFGSQQNRQPEQTVQQQPQQQQQQEKSQQPQQPPTMV